MRLIFAVLIGCVLAPVSAHAETGGDWLGRIIGAAEQSVGWARMQGVATLDSSADYVRTLPQTPGVHALAAAATGEGHWRFVNRDGETFTAASPEELRRAFAVLAPAAAGDSRLALYLAENTVFHHRELLKDLPQEAAIHVVIGSEAYRIVRRKEPTGERIDAEVRPDLFVEIADRRLFDEALFQLARPLDRARIRTIALAPGGPQTLARSPHLDASRSSAVTDAIEPDRLRHAMHAISGQTALVTGRIDGELLYFKPASGPERSLLLRDLTAAAEAADVNLIVLESAGARQPGSRNWLWRQIGVRNLDVALGRSTLADFLGALAGPNAAMAVSVVARGPSRTALHVRPTQGLAGRSAPGPFAGVLTSAVSALAGRIVTTGVEAHMRSAGRQHELDRRLLPGIASPLQWLYAALMALGLLGLPVARGWWQRLWPAERREDYGSGYGYRAACAVRATLLLLLFAPVAGPVSAPVRIARSLWHRIAPFARLRGATRA